MFDEPSELNRQIYVPTFRTIPSTGGLYGSEQNEPGIWSNPA
jgi:hypothetical protein